MRVGYLVSMKQGLPVFTYREIKLLRKRGIDVHLLIMRDGEGVAMPEPDWPVHKISYIGLLSAHIYMFITNFRGYLIKLWEAFKSKTVIHFIEAVYFLQISKANNIEALYSFEGRHALWIAYYIKFWKDVPIILSVHSEMLNQKTRINFTKRAIKNCYRVLTISEFNKHKIVSEFNVPEKKIKVTRLWSPYGSDDCINILIVGAWIYRKGHETILDAMDTLESKYRLWVVGEGGRSGKYYDVEREVDERGLNNRVIFWGEISQPKLRILYKACDIFVLPSRTRNDGAKEGIPVSIMEAMSLGCPVISTRHAGIPELVEEVLIDENDVVQLVESIRELGEKPYLRKQMGERNRVIIQNRYSEKNVDKIAGVLEDAVREDYRVYGK